MAARTIQRALSRDAGRLTTSSRRAANRPKWPKSLVFVTDHAVRRVDRLVDDGARQSEYGAPEGGCNDGVGKILGQALDGGASDPGFIQIVGIATDDVAQASPAFGQSAPRQAVQNTRDMLVKAALRQQRGCQDGYRQTRNPPRHDR